MTPGQQGRIVPSHFESYKSAPLEPQAHYFCDGDEPWLHVGLRSDFVRDKFTKDGRERARSPWIGATLRPINGGASFLNPEGA